MHRDILPTCPPEADLLGYSPHCSVQGLYVKNRLISVQGHPEFNENIMNELLSLRRGTVLDEEMYQIGKARAHHAHDGVKVAAAFAKFLLED
jgi:GMP synthase-like glutamine amidotransferase